MRQKEVEEQSFQKIKIGESFILSGMIIYNLIFQRFQHDLELK